jgi:hypothetical protein
MQPNQGPDAGNIRAAERPIYFGTHPMPPAQVGNPTADRLFPSDFERVRSGSARGRALKPKNKTRARKK